MAGLIVAVTVSWAWCLVAIRLGPRIGYVDRPDGSVLKVHDTPAVPLGGVGIYAGLHLALLVEGVFNLTLFLATTVVLVLGLIDDRRGLSPMTRLVVEFGAAVVLVVGLNAGGGDVVSLVVGVALVLFSINAVNLFDGLDGLASSVGLVASLGVALLAATRGLGVLETSVALSATLFGFLVLGWHPARVFLGDSGAYLLGMVLAATMIEASPDGGVDLVVAASLLGVFAIDLIVTILRRRRGGRPLFEGDRSHLYDQLRDRGWSVTRVVALAAGAQTVFVSTVVLADMWLPSAASAAVVAGVVLIVLFVLIQKGFIGVTDIDPTGLGGSA